MPDLKLTIEITGNHDDDLEDSLGEVQRLVIEGYTSGFGSNESGSYNFQIESIRACPTEN